MPASPTPPRFIEPQLSQIAEKAPTGDAWAHEIKYDGYSWQLASPGRRRDC
jgi:bifunctional non-homologous end joining protein LigD